MLGWRSEAADGAGDVAERVRAFVAVLVGVRQLAGSDCIEHDDARPRAPGYSRTPVANALGLIEFVVYCLASVIIGIAAGVTWIVVRLTPPSKPRSDTPTQ